MNVPSQIIAHFAVATAFSAYAYLVMYRLAGRPWNVSTIFHLYAVAALGLAALLICQANSRYISAARR